MALAVGPIRLSAPVLLAPMAGITDIPFRRAVRRHGVGITFSEMIASREMVHRTARSRRLAAVDDEDPIPAVQLAGTDPEIMAEAAKVAVDAGAQLIDINMGCPVKKVVRSFGGSALLRDEGLVERILRAVVAAVPVPVTLKTRTGWDDNSRNGVRIARIAEDSGIRMLTLHGRTRCQLFGGRADWTFIRRVKESVGIPVVANGDVMTVADAGRILEVSGADGVMIGRGAWGRPWFPGQVIALLQSGRPGQEPPAAEQADTVLAHYQDMIAYHGEPHGVRIARKHVGWYVDGRPGAEAFRRAFNRVECAATATRMLAAYFSDTDARCAA